VNRFAPSSDPSLTIKFYDRTPEKQASLGYQVREEPHGSVGAAAGHRAIAQSNSAEIAEALFRYTGPEEVCIVMLNCMVLTTAEYFLIFSVVLVLILFLAGVCFPGNLWLW
jgi:hypothetical protein